MLFSTQDSPEPVRVQSPYISETETKKVVKYLVDNYADEIPTQVGGITDEKQEESRNPIFDSSALSDDAGGGDDDDLYEEAREIVIQAGKASTSYIQRKLRVGYARAARLMDILEERGVIGPADGAKPRMVLGQDDNPTATEEVF
jgi:S-DNA-T family DNA segregation ATPase FtsK/SpoIIIE